MKFKLLMMTLMIGNISFSQSSQNSTIIDASNYYNYFKDEPGMSVNWLRECDAVPIIIDELIKDSIPYYTISVGDLLTINDSTRLVVTISFEKNGKDYGFLYEGNHGIPINKSDRDFLTTHKKVFYVQSEKNINGDTHFKRIDPIPNNIFLLKETCYWFQFSQNGTKYPVTKQVADNILRQDIREYLKTL
jgi:hypothetical protein